MAGSRPQNPLGSRVQADDAPVWIQHQHAGTQLPDSGLAGERDRVENAEAKQDDGIDQEFKGHPHQVEGQDRNGRIGIRKQQEKAASHDLPCQHEGHRPAVLRAAPEQPAEDDQIKAPITPKK